MKKINLITFYVVCLLLSNIAAAKLIGTNVINATGGIILFPVVYILGDILSELLSKKEMKRVINLGLFMNIFMVLFLNLIMILPYPDFYTGNEAFLSVFSSTFRIVIAGFISYLIGSHSNALIMNKLKEKDGTSKLFKRMMLSTLLGEFLDGFLFVTIAFLGIYPLQQIFTMIIIQVIFKTTYELICYPLSSRTIKYLRGKIE